MLKVIKTEQISDFCSRNSMSGLRTASESLVMELRCEVCNRVAPELDTLLSSRPISITLRRISTVRLQQLHTSILHIH